MRKLKRIAAGSAIGLLAGFVLIQLAPYGREHGNPPVVAEPAWDSAATRELAIRACFDCHSNETRWPWYSHVAPMSWLVQNHVDEGREILNFSEWQLTFEEAGEAADTVLEGEMPPRSYMLMHRDARLSSEERRLLAAGLAATLGRGEAAGEDEP